MNNEIRRKLCVIGGSLCSIAMMLVLLICTAPNSNEISGNDVIYEPDTEIIPADINMLISATNPSYNLSSEQKEEIFGSKPVTEVTVPTEIRGAHSYSAPQAKFSYTFSENIERVKGDDGVSYTSGQVVGNSLIDRPVNSIIELDKLVSSYGSISVEIIPFIYDEIGMSTKNKDGITNIDDSILDYIVDTSTVDIPEEIADIKVSTDVFFSSEHYGIQIDFNYQDKHHVIYAVPYIHNFFVVKGIAKDNETETLENLNGEMKSLLGSLQVGK